MKKLENKIMLITYADSLGKDLDELQEVLDNELKDVVGGIHILPFFPSSADRGFAPIRYDVVDPKFGDFSDIEKLSQDYYLMFDFMINHISRESEFFKDFKEKKDNSKYKDYFIRYKDFWPDGEPTKEQTDIIYKRKDRAPSTIIEFDDGSSEKLWCTFSEEQIDLNLENDEVKDFVHQTIKDMIDYGASIIRLDAFAYAIKRAGGTCFFEEPEIWELLEEVKKTAEDKGALILPEVHEHYSIQHNISDHGHWIYDFALPVLVLNALYTGESKYLKNWLEISPRHQFTTLDTHDGIGIVDAADLMPKELVETTKEMMFTRGANVNKIYNTQAYNNMDIYQVNTTYYSALGENDEAYLLARAIQFFAPGIPQVYYVGMLAGKNDIELIESTKNGRDINRHYYQKEEIKEEVQRDVVKNLFKLMRFRNEFPAFALDGEISIKTPDENSIVITRESDGYSAVLEADLKDHHFKIKTRTPDNSFEEIFFEQ